MKYLTTEREKLVEMHVRLPEVLRKKIVSDAKRKQKSINRYLVEIIFAAMISENPRIEAGGRK